MGKNYYGWKPLDHQQAEAAATEWAAVSAGDIHPDRRGLSRAAFFALFRLSAEERRSVLYSFCSWCGDHTDRCWCQNDE